MQYETRNETRNYFIKNMNLIELMSKKHKKFCRDLNYVERLLILIATITVCVSISGFASLVVIPIGVTSSAIRLKIRLITAGIKKY